MGVVVDAGFVELISHLVDDVEILNLLDPRSFIVLSKGRTHCDGIVHEVDDEGAVLAGKHPVEAREGLDDLHLVRDLLVDIHGDELRLIEASLELVGDQHDTVFWAVERVAQVLTPDCRVHGILAEDRVLIDDERLGRLRSVIRVHDLLAGQLARERDQRMDVGVLRMLLDERVEGLLVSNGRGARTRHDHCLRLALQQVSYVLGEMLHDELDLLGHVRRVKRHPLGQSALGSLPVDTLRVDHILAEVERRLVGNVAFQHIHDEAFVDGLPHRVAVEGLRLVLVGGWL